MRKIRIWLPEHPGLVILVIITLCGCFMAMLMAFLGGCTPHRQTANDIYYGMGPKTYGDVVGEPDMVKPEDMD